MVTAPTKTTPRTPEETAAISRLRALGQGVRVYCLERDRLYCVPSTSGDGSAYTVQVSKDIAFCSCPAGENDRMCKHLGAVAMYRESQDRLELATSLAVDVILHEQLERSLEEKTAELYS